MARMPDGRLVTSEKGIPRVKIYTEAGELQSVVAGPRQLEVSEAALGDARVDQEGRVFDVAVDADGRIFVLDPWKKCIRIFEPNEST
jgi:sugar lactone lactonase YvrE